MKIFVALLAAAFVASGAYADEVVGAAKKKLNSKETSSQDVRDRLLDKLFENYKIYSYPENTTVQFGLSLLEVDLDEEQNLLKAGVWFRYFWTDKRFTWNKEEFGVDVLRVPSNKVWLPDTTLYNGHNYKTLCGTTNVLIYSNGNVLWVPPCSIRSYCNITLSKDPYSEQVCSLKFGSWTFDGFTMGLDFWANETKIDTDNFMGSLRYKITKNVGVKELKYYDCCAEPYFTISYDLGLIPVPKGFDNNQANEV